MKKIPYSKQQLIDSINLLMTDNQITIYNADSVIIDYAKIAFHTINSYKLQIGVSEIEVDFSSISKSDLTLAENVIFSMLIDVEDSDKLK